MLNRSFNGPERGAPESPSLPQRQKHQQPQLPRGRTLGAVIKEKDEELALFLEMRKREKERQNCLLFNNTTSDELDHLPESKLGSSPMFKIASSAHTRRTVADDFLNSDSNKNDYDWLLTPPGTPLFPSLEKEVQRSPVDHVGTPKTRPTALKSRLADPLHPPPARASVVSRQPMSSAATGLGIRRPSSSGGLGAGTPRPATPTGRLPQPPGSRPARASTPTSRPSIAASAPAPRRSSTPTASRSSSSSVVSSAPTSRPAPPSRSFTPTRGPPAASATPPTRSASTPSATPTRSSSMPSATPTRSSSSAAAAMAAAAKKTAAPSPRGASPTVRSRPWKASEMPGFSMDTPPNLRMALPERPSSAARGRPSGARSASVEAASSVSAVGSGGAPRGRRQSCSPSRGRPVAAAGGAVAARSRPGAGAGEDRISPVVVGTKMVERVVNLRRLAPPKRDDRGSPSSSSSSSRGGKPASSSPAESSGFGRTLSNKSLDMAMRHMDIRRSIPSSLRPLMATVPASSMYSVRSGPGRSRGVAGVADSPLATSSNASSSELSLGNPRCLYASEAEDDARETRSTASSFPLPAAPPST